nr:reverse transcriptase domain-containing protein [Tanacetum cinerariifolium]
MFDETFSEAWDRFKDLLRKFPHHDFLKLHQIDTFYNALTQSDQDSLNATAGGNLLNRTPRDALTIIENKLKATVKAIEETYVTCGGPHPYYDCLAICGNTFDACAAIGPYNQGGNRYHPQRDLNYHASNQMGPPGFPLLNVQNSHNYNQNQYNQNQGFNQQKGKNFNQGNNNYQAPNNQAQDKVQTTSSKSTAHVQPPVVQVPIPEPDVASKPNPKPSIPYPSRLNDQKLHEKANNQMMKFLQIFQRLRFDICFVDALLHMPKFASTFKSILIDYDVDPRVSLILRRPFLRTAGALIDESLNQINVIDVACEEYAQEVLGFSDSSTSGNPTPSDPIIFSSSPSFTPFEGGYFILEEIETFLRTPKELSNLDDDYYDTEGDILYLEKLLNEDPSLNLPLIKNKDLKQVDVTMTKPSMEEPPELKLKDLPSYLEYAFLEGTDKLTVILSKELKDEEKAALLKVLKSHKRAIAWKIFDIKGIDPCFCTHKILIEDDFKLEIQHQRRVNPKNHEVIKKEVIKLLEAGLIYPIFDSLWVSPIHCVPKKGGMTVVENEDNELIPTRLVTGWRVYTDYQKLNDATRKDHFPLPFVDQML